MELCQKENASLKDQVQYVSFNSHTLQFLSSQHIVDHVLNISAGVRPNNGKKERERNYVSLVSLVCNKG